MIGRICSIELFFHCNLGRVVMVGVPRAMGGGVGSGTYCVGVGGVRGVVGCYEGFGDSRAKL